MIGLKLKFEDFEGLIRSRKGLRLVYRMGLDFVLPVWCLCFCFVSLRLVYPMLPFSLDCPFGIL